MIIEAQLKKLAPNALPAYVDVLCSPYGQEELAKWGFGENQHRLNAALATFLHEAQGLTILRESMTYTTASRIAAVWPARFTIATARSFVRLPRKLANVVYGGRMGNQRDGTNDDDGYDFRGSCWVQTTGYDSLLNAEKATGIPYTSNPQFLDDPLKMLPAALWELAKWHKYADMGERGFRALSNGINRGNPHSELDPIGWGDRLLHYRKALDVMGRAPAIVEDDILEVGDHGELVKAYQQRLIDLGYTDSRPDRAYGSRTRAAVLAFQAENGLVVDGKIGPQTRAALNSPDAKPKPLGNRLYEGKGELLALGSTTVRITETGKQAAVGAIGFSGAYGLLDATSTLPYIAGMLSEVSVIRTLAGQIGETWSAVAGRWYLVAIIAFYLLWRECQKVQWHRIFKHQVGLDTSR